MNYSLIILEIAVVALGLGILLADLWTPALAHKRKLGYVAAIGLGLILIGSFKLGGHGSQTAFHNMYVLDDLALFFKRFFLVAAIVVLVMAVEFADQFETGISEFYALILFALAGMMFAASANDFSMLFVSVELITVTFYVLTSFQRNRLGSLEAGVKYLILGALSSAFLVYGIALIFGTTGKLNFNDIAAVAGQFYGNKVFLMGILLVLVGLGFKIAAVPVQMWAPDVYQGSPSPATAFLAVGSKAAGFALLLRVLFVAVPDITAHWTKLLIGISMATILYGNLCAIPQRNLKRLLGYSSIANAGYMLMGVAALSASGQAAVLYYLGGYLFTVLAAFTVIVLVMRKLESEDIVGLAGLNHRSPLLATTLTLAMVSLAGIPPLAGFFGKFLLLKAVVEQGATQPAYYWLAAVALFGVVISIYYYFGVVRAIYWSKETLDLSPIVISLPTKVAIYACLAGMLFLGLFPNAMVNLADQAVAVLPLVKLMHPAMGQTAETLTPEMFVTSYGVYQWTNASAIGELTLRDNKLRSVTLGTSQPPAAGAIIVDHWTNAASESKLTIRSNVVQFANSNGPHGASTGINTWNPGQNWFVYRGNGMRVWAYDGNQGLWMLTATPFGSESSSIELLQEQVPAAVLSRLPDAVRKMVPPIQ